MIRKIDHNRTMLDREVHWEMPQPFRKISEYRSRQGIMGEADAAGTVLIKKDTLRPLSAEKDVLLCRGLLNEVRTYYEGGNGYPF